MLAGEFVCAVRYPDAWRFLEDEAQRQDAEAFLARLGRRLACTRQGGAWFAASAQVGAEERRAMREGFAEIKHNLRFLVGFFVHVMQALRQDQFLAPGSLIEIQSAHRRHRREPQPAQRAPGPGRTWARGRAATGPCAAPSSGC